MGGESQDGQQRPPWGHRESGKARKAPGAPGTAPHWATAAKQGVGTSVTPTSFATSLVWFSLGRGVLTEIYHPRLDCACTRDLALIVTDGREFASDERYDAEHLVEAPIDGVPLYRMTNSCRAGRYRIEKEVLAHPLQDAVLQRTRFRPTHGSLEDYRVFALLNPHVDNDGAENVGWLGEFKGVPMLFAQRRGTALALACSSPWRDGSAGFVGASDGLDDLKKNKRLTRHYDRADGGNVSLSAEVDLRECGGEWTIALGFGPDPDEAAHRALAALRDDLDGVRDDYVRGWRDWQATVSPPPPPPDGGRDLSRVGAMVLRSHTHKAVPGALVASLSTPWGESQEGSLPSGNGGYHLVWPRDICETAGGYLAIGARDEALRVLRYLNVVQAPDGHWPQNMWVSGAAFWEGIQLGETAIPILLLDHLRREAAIAPEEVDRLWPMARRAISYIVRQGPSTQQDRWENETGYTPFTLALMISSLLVAAELADERGETQAASYLRETADAWNASIERWLYVTGTALARRVGVDGYYVRIMPAEYAGGAASSANSHPTEAPGSRDGTPPPEEVVSPDALALVRFGLRSADDPRIVETVKVIDAVLRVETPVGPSWRRYNGDRYGERADGTPYDGRSRGVGRAWPLLTGERAHYELASGRRDEAVRLLAAMASFANETGLIPEQVWDADDIPAKRLFRGRPTGSAMPLVWAHAEYLKLCRSLRDGRIFDRPPQPARRYLEERIGSDRAIWRFDRQIQSLTRGMTLRIEVLAAASVRWSDDNWSTQRDVPTRDTTLGVHVVDLPTDQDAGARPIVFTFRWLLPDRWEGRNFTVSVETPPETKGTTRARRKSRTS